MNTFTIAIGRNVNSVPMSDYHWSGFWLGLQDAILSDAFADVAYYVKGESNSDEWGAEDTYVIGGTLADRPGGPALALATYAALANLAKQYGQDAIAVTIGRTEFVTPDGIDIGEAV